MINIDERTSVKLPGITSLFISFEYNPNIVQQLKLIDPHFYDKKTHEWEIGLADLSNILDKLCVEDQIQLNLLPYYSTIQKKYELHQYPVTLFDHQIEAVQYGLNHNRWLLLDDPGTGKSLSILCIAKELKERDNIQHCLIICGVNSIKLNWKKEIAKHSELTGRVLGEYTTKRGKYRIGGMKERISQLQSPIEEFFVILNIETLRDKNIIKAIKDGPNKFDMIVCDEIHTCKNIASQQGSNLLELTAKYMIGATGTLLLNDPVDTFVPLKWLGFEKCSRSVFEHYYCVFTGKFNTLAGYKNLGALKQELSEISLRRTKDILNLPPKIVKEEYVEMAEDQQKFYDEVKEGIKSQVDKVTLRSSNLLALASRLRQVTACPSILSSNEISSAKIDRAVELVNEIVSTGNKVVIFSTFKETVNVLKKRLEKFHPLSASGDDKDEIISERIDKFQNDPENKCFICTWQKLGTGHTLTAASYEIFIDIPWTSGVFTQAQDRCHRVGAKNTVIVYHLIASGTFDEHVLDIVNAKAALSEYVIDDQIPESFSEILRSYILDL